MKETFENVDEYFNIMKPLMLYEIWSKISESYNVIISKTPSLETCIFEKSLMKYVYYILLYYLILKIINV